MLLSPCTGILGGQIFTSRQDGCAQLLISQQQGCALGSWKAFRCLRGVIAVIRYQGTNWPLLFWALWWFAPLNPDPKITTNMKPCSCSTPWRDEAGWDTSTRQTSTWYRGVLLSKKATTTLPKRTCLRPQMLASPRLSLCPAPPPPTHKDPLKARRTWCKASHRFYHLAFTAIHVHNSK